MKKVLIILLVVLLTSCGSNGAEYVKDTKENISAFDKAKKESEGLVTNKPNEKAEVSTPGPKTEVKEKAVNAYTICIDPGHQRNQIKEKEPIAKGSSEMKPGVSSGATGVVTKKNEYEVNLEVSNIIKEKLQAKGYNVVMTRESHDVFLSNIKRAEIGNSVNANLVVRIHADSNEASSVTGYSILYPSGEYTKGIQSESKKAAQYLDSEISKSTNSKSRGLMPRSDMTGFNWSSVPSIIVEMGFLSNPNDDRLLSDKGYQEKMASGIVSGIEEYLKAN